MHLAQGRRQSVIAEKAPSLRRAAAPAARDGKPAPAAYRHAPHTTANSVRHGYFGAGAPAEPRVRSRVEAATGSDLSSTRLHTGESAQRMAESVSARAFTVGRDVHFARGQYRPGSADGDRLIAHELVHVAQQGARPVAPGTKLPIGDAHSASERQAESIASTRDGDARGDVHVAHQRPHVARAPAVETKEVQGVELHEEQMKTMIGSGYWEPLLRTVYDVQKFDAHRWETDHEERDAIGAEVWVQHLLLQPLTSTVNILRVLPPRVPGTQPLLYRLQFEPAIGKAKPKLRIQFVAEGGSVSAVDAPSPKAGASIAASITPGDFPGGFNAFAASFPDEIQQLGNWINAVAPQGNFSRVVHTLTPSSGHETWMLVSGSKAKTTVSNVEVRWLSFSAPTGMGKPGTFEYRYGYRQDTALDFELEQRQALKKDALGSISGVDTLPLEERSPVKYAIFWYYENGTRNAEVDAIVPIPGARRNMLYKLRFEPKTNNVRVRVIGEEGKDVVLDPAKRKLDVRLVNGFNPSADAPTLKSWISNRYKGVSPTGTTLAEVVKSTNTKLDAEAGTKDWFANNYAMPVLNESDGDARLKTVGLHDKQRVGIKKFEPPELRLVEISLELMSDAVLNVVRGTALVRQDADISRKWVEAKPGKPAHFDYDKVPGTGGQTWAPPGGGGDRTIALYDQILKADRALFAGDRTASGQVNAVAFSAMLTLHEFGHVVAESGSTIAEFTKKFGDLKAKVHAAPVTRYAAKKPTTEFFPEAFAIFSTDPKWMLDNLPSMHAWFVQLAKQGSMP